MTDVKIKIQGLYKIFGNSPIAQLEKIQGGITKQQLLENHNHVLGLDNISLDMYDQKIQVIMGLSGSGKSTLIRHINRLIEPTAGKLLVDGEDVLTFPPEKLREFRRKRASMVFQKFGLLPHKTVIENAMYGLLIQGTDEKDAQSHAQRWLDRVGLTGFENKYPAQLSGGMQQRVGLARALATDADILLMDEAFSALDPLIRTDMQNVLLELQNELNKTIVFITHDLDEALKIGDSIAILRDGALVQCGDAQEIILSPADDYVKDFIKDINRAKVIRLSSLDTEEVYADAPVLPAALTIEDAFKELTKHGSNVANIQLEGTVQGSISIQNMVRAIA